MAHGCQARESQRQDDSASQDTPSKLWLKLDPKVKLRRFGSFTPSKRWLKPGIFTSRGCRWMCIYDIGDAQLYLQFTLSIKDNCNQSHKSIRNGIQLLHQSRSSQRSKSQDLGWQLHWCSDRSIYPSANSPDCLEKSQMSSFDWSPWVNLNRLSEDQTFGCWVEAFLQPFMQHHHAKTARQQSYFTCGVLVLIKLLYMRVEKRLAWSRRHCPCPSPVALLSMQSWPSRYIGSCITVFSNTAQNPGCTTNNTCISAALPS